MPTPTSLRLPLLVASLLFAGTGVAAPGAPANAAKPAAKSAGHRLVSLMALQSRPGPASQERLRYALLTALLAKANTPLRGHPNCGDAEWKTVGQFIAWSLSFYRDGQANGIRARCTTEENGRPTCSIEFDADSKGESPWACGLRFNLDRTETKPDLASLTCTGSC